MWWGGGKNRPWIRGRTILQTGPCLVYYAGQSEQSSARRFVTTLAIAVALTLTVAAQVSHASIHGLKQLQVDFTDASDATNKATWSEPDKLTISAAGLGRDGDVASSRDGWIQTRPLALGLSWRPPYAVSVRVEIHPSPTEFAQNSGQKSTPYGGDVYVRDRKSTRPNSSHVVISYSVFCLKKKKNIHPRTNS